MLVIRSIPSLNRREGVEGEVLTGTEEKQPEPEALLSPGVEWTPATAVAVAVRRRWRTKTIAGVMSSSWTTGKERRSSLAALIGFDLEYVA